MSNHDDYDLIDEEQPQPRSRRGSPLIWLVIALVLIIFGFAVGLAAVRILTRLNDESTPVAIELTSAPPTTVVQTPGPGEADAATAVITQTTPATVTAMATPSITPSPVPCQFAADPDFPNLDGRGDLGCPTSPSADVVWAAWEPFERGAMLWRSDTDRAYIFANDGRWFPIDARWSGEALSPRGAPPPGLYEPQRGFGYVWGADDAIFSLLGWATDEERGFCARVQEFEQGFVVESVALPSCTPEGLYNQATSSDWQPLLIVAADENQTGVSAQTLPDGDGSDNGDDAAADNVNSRPARNGVSFAPRAATLPLFDGNFSEWPNGWQPLDSVVYDVGDYGGSADLRGLFQAAWSEEGLILAVRVNDDAYGPGPSGSDMWQGDGLEIHFDRQLADDYQDWDVNEDDYQIGVSFGPALDKVDAYRWIPYAAEMALALPGAVRPLTLEGAYRGYNAELLIPWSAFDLDGQQLAAGERYGFNLSINDNDSDLPAQETTISLSPARTTHDNPTEWGTLVLTQ